MVSMGALLALGLSGSIWEVQRITRAELQEIVADHKDAKFAISQYQTGHRLLSIELPEKGRHFRYEMPANEPALAVLRGRGIVCPTYVQGRDFEVLGAPGRWTGVMAVFILAAGTVILLKRKKYPIAACNISRGLLL